MTQQGIVPVAVAIAKPLAGWKLQIEQQTVCFDLSQTRQVIKTLNASESTAVLEKLAQCRRRDLARNRYSCEQSIDWRIEIDSGFIEC